jgi:hypothetical protein
MNADSVGCIVCQAEKTVTGKLMTSQCFHLISEAFPVRVPAVLILSIVHHPIRVVDATTSSSLYQ